MLTVGEALLKRGIMVDGKCKRCGEIKTTTPVMFLCPFEKSMGEGSRSFCFWCLDCKIN